MAYQVRSLRQEQARLAADLRARGRSWVQVAEVFRKKYRVNARMALRLAHGWSQRRAADEWNLRWPDESKTLKSFSYWEVWPSSTGYEPSLRVLEKLARLYQCRVADLVCDLADHRDLDTIAHPQKIALPPGRSGAGLVLSDEPSLWAALTGLPLPDDFAIMLVKHLSTLISTDHDSLDTPGPGDHAVN